MNVHSISPSHIDLLVHIIGLKNYKKFQVYYIFLHFGVVQILNHLMEKSLVRYIQ